MRKEKKKKIKSKDLFDETHVLDTRFNKSPNNNGKENSIELLYIK